MTIQSPNFSSTQVSRLSNFDNYSSRSDPSNLNNGLGGGNQLQQLAKLFVGLMVAADAIQGLMQNNKMSDGLGSGSRGMGDSSGHGGHGMGNGMGDGLGRGGNSLEDFLSNLMNPQGNKGSGSMGSGGQNMSMEDLLEQLLQAVLPGGQQTQQEGGGKNPGLGGPERGAGGTGGAGGAGGAGPTHADSGLKDQLGLGDGQDGLSKLGDKLLQGFAEALLQNLFSPTKDGGGQLSEGLQELKDLLSDFMDGNKNEFGSPAKPGKGSGSGGREAPPIEGEGSSREAGGPTGSCGTGSSSGVGGGSGTGGGTGIGGADSAGAVTSSLAGDTNKVLTLDDFKDNLTDLGGGVYQVDKTLEIPPGATLDAGNATLTASKALGDGGQSEDQQSLIDMAEGSGLKNLTIGDNGADGIHVFGDANLDNVHWSDVGEDALTVKDSGKDGMAEVNITNSSAQKAADKIFQLNDDAQFNINGFKADDFGKLVRTNGGQQGNWEINLDNIEASNGKHAFVQTDSAGTTINAGANITMDNVKNGYVLPDGAKLNR